MLKIRIHITFIYCLKIFYTEKAVFYGQRDEKRVNRENENRVNKEDEN